MGAVGESVDDRLLSGGGKLDQIWVAAQARDYTVHIPVQNPGGVADALAIAKLDVLLAQRRPRTPQACDRNLERDARAVRGSLEEHRDVAAPQRAQRPAPGLDVMREVQQSPKLRGFEIADVEKITAEKTVHTWES